MSSHWLKALSASLLAIVLATGCAAPTSGDEASPDDGASTSDLTASSDAAIQGKLRGILKDVTFMSEGDFPYVVFEGEAVTEKRLSTKLVRQSWPPPPRRTAATSATSSRPPAARVARTSAR